MQSIKDELESVKILGREFKEKLNKLRNRKKEIKTLNQAYLHKFVLFLKEIDESIGGFETEYIEVKVLEAIYG